MSWEQDISEKLGELETMAVRFDVDQELSEAQKNRARNNIGVNATATQISGNDYMITLQ